MHNFKTKEEHAAYYQKIARTQWFAKNEVHVSEYEHGLNASSITVVDFCQPNTNAYAVRYIFASLYLYVSGDLGCAVFNWTWRTRPTDRNWHSLWYISEKLAAREGDDWDYDPTVCRNTIQQILLEPDARGRHSVFPDQWSKAQKELFHALMQEAKEATSTAGWALALDTLNNEAVGASLSDLDGDYWEWCCDAGQVLPPRIIGIITGLQMIQEELAKEAPKEQ